jgi:hypothetical protein
MGCAMPLTRGSGMSMRRRAPEKMAKSPHRNSGSEGLGCLLIRGKKLSALTSGTAAVDMRQLHPEKEYIIVPSGDELSQANSDR